MQHGSLILPKKKLTIPMLSLISSRQGTLVRLKACKRRSSILRSWYTQAPQPLDFHGSSRICFQDHWGGARGGGGPRRDSEGGEEGQQERPLAEHIPRCSSELRESKEIRADWALPSGGSNLGRGTASLPIERRALSGDEELADGVAHLPNETSTSQSSPRATRAMACEGNSVPCSNNACFVYLLSTRQSK